MPLERRRRGPFGTKSSSCFKSLKQLLFGPGSVKLALAGSLLQAAHEGILLHLHFYLRRSGPRGLHVLADHLDITSLLARISPGHPKAL